MKLVYKTNDINEPYDLQGLFDEKGIPSKVLENSVRNRGTHIPDGNELWIFIITQYNDALILIDNPGHIVNDPVNVSDFNKQLNSKNINESVNVIYSKFIKYGLIFIIGITVVISIWVSIKT